MEQFVQLTCQRCGHSWVPNVPCPIVCSKCHSPYWRLPRKNGRPMPQRVVPNTFHQEPLVTETPQIQTPIYAPQPPQYVHVEPHVVYNAPPPTYNPPPLVQPIQPTDYTQPKPPIRFPSAPEPIFQEINREYIQPDRDMPLPLRKCKLCGYKGYGESFRNHNCRR